MRTAASHPAGHGKERTLDRQITKDNDHTGTKRVYASYREEINAVPDIVFPLLCPVAEHQWIDGWSCTLVYTKSGVNEEGCIFKEGMTGPALVGKAIRSTWVTNRWDPENHAIQFVIFSGDSAVVRYTVVLKAIGGSGTVALMDFEFTALDEESSSLDEGEIRTRLLAVAAFISKSLKHYCETGKILKGEGQEEMRASTPV
jgi:hypothetical protein